MRFIIRELAYEKVVAAGRLQYEQDGRPTGAVESWRLTTATPDYCFLRVDLDAREAESGHTYLYHLTLAADGRPERLQYRYWGGGLQVTGNVLLEAREVTATRMINDERFEEEVTVPAGYGFWFPSSIGLGLLAHREGTVTGVTLHAAVDQPAAAFQLLVVEAQVTPGETETITLMERIVVARSCTIQWAGQKRSLWLDEHHWPVKMRRHDGLTAVATRYIRYQPSSPRITGPA